MEFKEDISNFVKQTNFLYKNEEMQPDICMIIHLHTWLINHAYM